jgi:ribosomal protein S1
MYLKFLINLSMNQEKLLKLNQQVKVKVLEVDSQRKRISLSIKQLLEVPARKSLREIQLLRITKNSLPIYPLETHWRH